MPPHLRPGQKARSNFRSVEDLHTAFIAAWNRNRAHPFRWTFTGYPLQADYAHVAVRAERGHLRVFIDDGPPVARATPLGANQYGLSFHSHTGRWEKTPRFFRRDSWVGALVRRARRTSSRQAERGIPTDRCGNAVRSRQRARSGGLDRAGRRIPGRAEHLMVDATTRRPAHPPVDAGGHPGVDASIYRWIQASCGRGGSVAVEY